MSVNKRVKRLLIQWLEVDEDLIVPEASLIGDLGADSLSLVELVMAMEDAFDLNISSEDVQQIETVQELEDYLHKRSVL